ncbi:peptidyl-prolyl cis-trans isomerase [Phaffia rhodozyma]|uniref:peptidylprolyl isomerase n=1 Tax=Phaffia rhodozyma TaxID=264483 RepID=A0A0F7SW00_PHARH|nr:peptidyl-prolyl cis-trans isomerase [Phaffia rhodozyma]
MIMIVSSSTDVPPTTVAIIAATLDVAAPAITTIAPTVAALIQSVMSASPPPTHATKRPRDTTPPVSGGEPGSLAVLDAEPESDEDDIGPMPEAPGDDDAEDGPQPPGEQKKRKKRKVLAHEKLFLDHLPSADRYYKSFMHRDVINTVTVTKTDFVLTTSMDGHLKLWKKQAEGIEFVKHYRAHLGPVLAVSGSSDGTVFATVGSDGCKVFDVVNFDMINMLKLDFEPKTCCWIHQSGTAQTLLAISEQGTSTIRIYDGRGDGKPLYTLDKLHRHPVHLMVYNDRYDTVISADEGGFIEYWQPSEPWELPTGVKGLWEFKSSTDLYEFKKAKSLPTSIVFSPQQTQFSTLSLPDRQVRIFNFLSGKKTRQYDESLQAIQEMQQAGTAVFRMDDMEFGRRLAADRELEKIGLGVGSCAWDESGGFLLYPTMLGIKVVNTVSNRVVRVLGKDETSRWMNLALYQGAPSKKGLATIAMAASANPLLAERESRDPTLFCTAYKRSRFYLFSQTEPEDTKGGDRDVFNERPTREEQSVAMAQPVKIGGQLGTSAVIHTTKGDIHFKLFPDQAPKAVENFCTHAKEGYYNGIIFHRIIKKFMLQSGDPLGDGTGGESIWGSEFEDEFDPSLRHDRPYTLSMANAGPKTNGSQFFITTVPTPWLDDKHTVFGRATLGLDVIHAIEDVRTDKGDKPYDDIKMVSIDIGN